MKQQAGYTLMEVLAVVVILGILAAVGSTYLGPTIEHQRFEDTRREMDRLANAIAGDPSLVSGGVRTDCGYIGDIGAMPPNLSALVTNPGGYTTWDGPYITDDFSTDGSSSEYLRDGWGNSYSYSGGNTITSSGNGSTLTREIASSLDKLLRNSMSFAVIDIDNTPPGSTHRDSVRFVLTYPDGSGSYANISRFPDNGGFVSFDSIPIGNHTLRVIFTSTNDTITKRVNVNPGGDYYSEIQHYDDIW
jgi:general secretion pathway protein G